MLNYLKSSIKRKIARRITKEYPPVIDSFNMGQLGVVQFANWSNPLTSPIQLDANMVSFFRKFIKPGDFVIDIGANIGDTTVPIALCAGAEGLTLGFDPNPYVYKILSANATLNKDKTNIIAEQYAIANQEEEYFFISSEASFANGGISPTKKSIHGKFVCPEKIKGVVLKDFLKNKYDQWLPKLSFIKIDTEGYDKEIIKSITSLIDDYKPTIIAESFGDANAEAKLELYDVIKRLNYKIFYFQDFHIDAPIQELINREEILKFKDTINIYAVPII